MKRILAFTLAITFCWVSVAVGQDKDEAWFDMENCAICKNFAKVEGLMTKVKWETHMLDNGMLTVTVMPDDMKEAWAGMMKDVESTVALMEKGEEMELCNFCTSMGSLVESGVTRKDIQTAAGQISIFTSDDPEVVEMIHKHAERTVAAHKKMMEAMGHDHDEDHK